MVGDTLFWAAAYKLNGERLVDYVEGKGWDRQYHPKPATEIRTAGELEQARPDITFGYIHQDLAGNDHEAAFDDADETLFRQYAVCQGILFPFFTVEMKSASAGGTIPEAIVQSARSGAVALNALHAFFEASCANCNDDNSEGMHDPACQYAHHILHFSAVADLQIAQLYVHWIEHNGKHHETGKAMPRYRMEKVSQVEDFRRSLKHILAWARGSRLEAIRDAAPGFRERLKQSMQKGLIITPPMSKQGSYLDTRSALGGNIFEGVAMPLLHPIDDEGVEDESSNTGKRKRKI